METNVGKNLRNLLQNDRKGSEQLKLITDIHPQLMILQGQLLEFEESLKTYPTAVFWLNFPEMSNILYQGEGNWTGHLCESAKMLSYLVAAGHYKYGQQPLPLYLSEMKMLVEKAPEVHVASMNGAFIVRHTDGSHNGVSLYMLLEQRYNKTSVEH